MEAEHRFQHSKYPPPAHTLRMLLRGLEGTQRDASDGGRWSCHPDRDGPSQQNNQAKPHESRPRFWSSLIHTNPPNPHQRIDKQKSRAEPHVPPPTTFKERGVGCGCLLRRIGFAFLAQHPISPRSRNLPGRAGKFGADPRLPLSLWRNDFIVPLT